MKKEALAVYAALFVLQGLITALAAGQPAAIESKPAIQAVPPGYRIGPGDTLEIAVWREETLNRQVLVRPDGGISFPLAGEIKAGGLSVDELRSALTQRLSQYFSDPELNVSLVTANQKIYVVGKVNRPGEYVTPNRVSVMQALSMAGGLAPFADNDDILVIRHAGDREITFPFDYDDVAGGAHLDQNIDLERGDVVVVP